MEAIESAGTPAMEWVVTTLVALYVHTGLTSCQLLMPLMEPIPILTATMFLVHIIQLQDQKGLPHNALMGHIASVNIEAEHVRIMEE